MSSIEERVKSIVAEQLGLKTDEVTPSASFVADLGAASMDTLELVMAFEDEFATIISPEDAAKIITVEHLINYVTIHHGPGRGA